MPIEEEYPYELQQVNLVKISIKILYQVKFQQVHPVTRKTSTMKIGAIEKDTPETHPRVIPKVLKHQKLEPYWRFPLCNSITLDQEPREFTM